MSSPPGRCVLPRIDVGVAVALIASGQPPLGTAFALVLLRLGLVLNSLFNEWGHIIVAALLGCSNNASPHNLLGHVSFWTHCATLIPLREDKRGELTVKFAPLSHHNAERVRVGGFAVGLVLTLLVGVGRLHFDVALTYLDWAYAIGAGLALLGAWLSDIDDKSPYRHRLDCMACGNVTLIGRLDASETNAFPERARQLLLGMLSISQIRGSQSGGGAAQVRVKQEPRQVIAKCLNSKRGDLATRMTRAIGRSVARARPSGNVFLVQTHVRYATSSVSSKHEAHPFRFVELVDRGPRRVWSLREGKVVVETRSIETALTHNGDMDGLKWRGQTIHFPDLGYFLEHILGVNNRWVGDSPQLAAAIELFLTKGLWVESLRLAFHLTVAPRPPDFAPLAHQESEARRRAARVLLSEYPAPSLTLLKNWETLVERIAVSYPEAWLTKPDEVAQATRAREHIVDGLVALRNEGQFLEVAEARMRGFARAAVNAFFDNDLYVALRKLEPALLGTFGVVVSSTLEPNSVVVLSRGQPLSIGFHRESGTVAVVSERTALKLRTKTGEQAFEERLDLDLCRGEIGRLRVDASGPIHLTLYGISDGKEHGPNELQRDGRVVALHKNPYVSAMPIPAHDRVEEDLQVLGSLLTRVALSFSTPNSHNYRTAEAFAEALLKRMRPRLLVIGVTNDLWLSQQFVENFHHLYPAISATAVSSNQVLREPDSVSVDNNTVVLAVSQSGQDFPTLAALLLLGQRLGNKANNSLFVMTGEVDSLMGQAVGQQYATGAKFSERIFTNESGFRPTESAIATVSATHHCLCGLLLFLAQAGLDHTHFDMPPYGLALKDEELVALRERGETCVRQHAAQIVGDDSSKNGMRQRPAFQRPARRWQWHILEGLIGFMVLVLVLELNLQFAADLLPSRFLLGLIDQTNVSALVRDADATKVLGSQLDVLFYAFLIPLSVWVLRRLQNRSTLHRQGIRELLIGDTGYVHRIAWLFSRKLFSLSYGFASIKPYSADCLDELVLTHEPVRGGLVLIGVPDERRPALKARADAAVMTIKQFDSSRSFAGVGVELVTIGHHSLTGTSSKNHIQLPSAEPNIQSPLFDVLCEGMFDSWERLLAMQVLLNEVASGVASFGLARYDRSRTKDQVFAPTTAAPVSAAAVYQLLSRASERYERFEHLSLPFDVKPSLWQSSGSVVKTTIWEPEAMLPPRSVEHELTS